jgi:4-diphosphocytidyl-2-C-methyl-D-erythritol kinase
MKIRAPAKINLFLQITGKRDDGYHELISFLCPISLYDTIFLNMNGSATRVICDHPDVPSNESNLAFQATAVFGKEFKKCNGGVEIKIEKKIPVGAGLGGGSSDAASVLLALNEYYHHPFSISQLMAMGLTLGADVPFFMINRPAIATGIGEYVMEFKGNLSPYPVLVIYPNFSISTAYVYKNFDLGLTNCKKKLKNALLKQHRFDISTQLYNDLEAVTASRYPFIRTAKKALTDNGAAGSLMSGSGSAVFGLFNDFKAAERAKHTITKTHSWRLFLSRLLI